MPTGKVKWFDAKKGFGFITPDDGTMDIFFHRTGISSSVAGIAQDNQQVEYEIGEDRKGPCAVNVKTC